MRISSVNLVDQAYGTITLSAGVITDAMRAAGVQGDGLPLGSGMGFFPAVANLNLNGSFEVNADGYISSGSNSTARSTAQAKFGTASGLCTYGGTVGSGCAVYGITITNTIHAYSAWVYVPTAFDGGGLTLGATNFTGATISNGVVNMALRDQWQRVTGTITPNAGDLAGDFRLTLTDSQPTPGTDFVYIDGFQIEAGSLATPFTPTSRVAGTAALPMAGLASSTQGWVFARVEWPYPNTALPASAERYVFSWRTGDNDRIGIAYAGPSSNRWQIARLASGAGAQNNVADTFTANESIGALSGWTDAHTRFAFDGGNIAQVANTSTPTVPANAFIGDFTGAGVSNLYGYVRWLGIGSGLVVNADSAALNAFGNTPPSLNDLVLNLSAGARPTALWDASTAEYVLPVGDSLISRPAIFSGNGFGGVIG